MKLILTALSIVFCTSPALAQYNNGMVGYGGTFGRGYNNYSPSFQQPVIGPCGNFPQGISATTTPLYGGGSVTEYNGDINGSAYTYTSPLTGTSTTTYSGF
jgi:hypothetical protein